MVSHNEKGNILRLDIQIWQGNLYSGCNKFFTSLWHNYITDPHLLHHKIELITPAHTHPHTLPQLLSKTSACWGWAQSCLDAMAVWDMVTGLPSLQTRQHSFWSPGGRKKDLFFHTESLIVWHVSCFYWASGLSGSLADFSWKNDSPQRFFCFVFNHLVHMSVVLRRHSGHSFPLVGHPRSPASWWKNKVPDLSLYHFASLACHACEIEFLLTKGRQRSKIKGCKWMEEKRAPKYFCTSSGKNILTFSSFIFYKSLMKRTAEVLWSIILLVQCCCL